MKRPFYFASAAGLALLALTGAGCATIDRAGSGAASVAASFSSALAEDRQDELLQPLGDAVGSYMARRRGGELPGDDKSYHDPAAQRALWSKAEGYGENWRNPDSGDSGFIKPSSPVFRSEDAICRSFHDLLRRPGLPELGVDGTACLTGGIWTVDY